MFAKKVSVFCTDNIDSPKLISKQVALCWSFTDRRFPTESKDGIFDDVIISSVKCNVIHSLKFFSVYMQNWPFQNASVFVKSFIWQQEKIEALDV